jgi:excisionase family DNA binding protein
MPEKEFFTTAELADLLGVATHTVKRQKRAGRLAFHKVGRRVLFRRDDVEAFLAACRRPGKAITLRSRNGNQHG